MLRPMMRGERWKLALIAVSALVAGSVVPRSAVAADVSRSLPEGGGFDALSVAVDVATGEIRTTSCTKAPCTSTGVSATIPTRLEVDPRNLKIEALDLGPSRRALWVHVPSKKDPIAYDLVQIGARVLFQGATGFTSGQPGSMTGRTVEMVEVGGKRQLVVADISESFVLCGRGRTYLSAKALDPASLEFTPVVVDVLSSTEQKQATPLVLSAHAGAVTAPLAPLFVSAGTTSREDGRALVDGDDKTVWSADGTGRGEIALFRAPIEVPISRLTLTITKPAAAPGAAPSAAPRTLFLTTGAKNWALTLPEDALLKGGASYDVNLPEPIKSSCVGLVFDQAYDRGQPKARLALGEVRAYSALEVGGATLETLAPMLSAGGATSDTALAILKRAGEKALVPLGDAWAKLDEFGRELAIDAAAAAPCGTSTPLLLQGLCSTPETARKAESALARCNRASMIVNSVHSDKALACPKIANMLALLGREAALVPLTAQLGKGDLETRNATRQAWAMAAREVPGERLAPLLDQPSLDADRRLEILRALGPRVVELSAEASAALDGIVTTDAPFARRWLAVGPVAELARGGSAKDQSRFVMLLSKDRDWPVRARAAELAQGIASAQAALVLALDDSEPRVREAALHTIAVQKTASASPIAAKRLDSDPWTFVRLAAAQALGAMPAGRDVDESLGTALKKEKSSPVEEAILDALAAHKARGALESVRERFDDDREDASVRTAAARTLGALCDAEWVSALTKVALHADDPLINSEGLALTLASIEALGAIHPKDVASRLKPLDADGVKDAVRATVRRAIANPGTCR